MITKLLFNKQLAYKRCFTDGMGNLTAAGELVMKDLMKFCNVHTSTASLVDGKIDPVHMALEEGRRTVFNRIQYYLKLNDRQLQQARELQE